jgi:hypothetical protein
MKILAAGCVALSATGGEIDCLDSEGAAPNGVAIPFR